MQYIQRTLSIYCQLYTAILCQYFAISPAIHSQLHAYTQKHIIIGVATHAIIMQAQNVKI